MKYPVLSSLVALNFIMGKGFGVRILAFETLSWSDTILWSMLAAGNSYTEKKIMDENCTFAFKKLTLLSKNFKNLLGKLNWSDDCTWIKNCIIINSIQKLHNSVQILPNSIQKHFTKWKYPHISAISNQLCIWICYLFFSTNFAHIRDTLAHI